jgi:hypothetical protein
MTNQITLVTKTVQICISLSPALSYFAYLNLYFMSVHQRWAKKNASFASSTGMSQAM